MLLLKTQFFQIFAEIFYIFFIPLQKHPYIWSCLCLLHNIQSLENKKCANLQIFTTQAPLRIFIKIPPLSAQKSHSEGANSSQTIYFYY